MPVWTVDRNIVTDLYNMTRFTATTEPGSAKLAESWVTKPLCAQRDSAKEETVRGAILADGSEPDFPAVGLQMGDTVVGLQMGDTAKPAESSIHSLWRVESAHLNNRCRDEAMLDWWAWDAGQHMPAFARDYWSGNPVREHPLLLPDLAPVVSATNYISATSPMLKPRRAPS